MAPPKKPIPTTSQRRNRPGAGANPPPNRPGQLFYAIVSLGAFLFGLPILSVMLWNAQSLVLLALSGNVYYVRLLALGLATSVFLFHSYARYKGRNGWGVLELVGHIVDYPLVVVGDFYLAPAIPSDRLQGELDLDAVASGYSSSHLKAVPNANDVVIPLTRPP